MQPGSGQLAMQAAVCTDLLREWGAEEDARQANKIMEASFNDLLIIYRQALSTLQFAQPLPQQSRKFTRDEALSIKTIVTSAITKIYRGSCTFEFL